MSMGRCWRTVTRVALLAGAAACAAPGPRPIAYGRESCARCSMTVSDPRFGAELVLRTGKVRVFDSIECLAAYVAAYPPEKVASAWVTDVTRPGKLIAAAHATYVRTRRIDSPMGLGLAALGPASAATRARAGFEGPTLTWPQVLALAARGSA